jgi:hypothetical protein
LRMLHAAPGQTQRKPCGGGRALGQGVAAGLQCLLMGS